MNRYGDISKFITDIDQLQVTDDEVVYISSEDNYDIAIGLGGCYDTFENLKPFMVTIAKHICEMDNIVLKFNRTMRLNNKSLSTSLGNGYRYDYSTNVEKEPVPIKKKFSYILSLVYIEKPNFVTFDYWATDQDNQFYVTFEYKDGRFFLRTYGMVKCIPDDWDKS